MLDCNNSVRTPEDGPEMFKKLSVATQAQGV